MRLLEFAVVLLICSATFAAPTLNLRDTIGKAWEKEPIAWDVTEYTDAIGDKFTLLRDGKPVVAQKTVNEDGRVHLLFIVDQLEENGQTDLAIQSGKTGPTTTDLRVEERNGELVLTSSRTAIRLGGTVEGDVAAVGPILGVRLPSGQWTASSRYDATITAPVKRETRLLERGPVRLRAKTVTTFKNGRTHTMTFTLWRESGEVIVQEQFDLGPDTMYQMVKPTNDVEALAWEWWSWYGDREGTQETHPNYWRLQLNSNNYQPTHVTYLGEPATDSARGRTAGRGYGNYTMAYPKAEQLEKYITPRTSWRPDGCIWYATSAGDAPGADGLAIVGVHNDQWRNPNILPTPKDITLRTNANDMRVITRSKNNTLELACPIGLGARAWVIKSATKRDLLGENPPKEAEADHQPPTPLDQCYVSKDIGLNTVRHWITDWEPTSGVQPHPRLFRSTRTTEAYYQSFIGAPAELGDPVGFFLAHNESREAFDRAWANIEQHADKMVKGTLARGFGGTFYPGWMLGYWHGTAIATGLDNLAASPFADPDAVSRLRKQLAILTYCLTHESNWPRKQTNNQGWGSMNMPVGRWAGLTMMALTLADHPMAQTWLKDTARYHKILLEQNISPDGASQSCPHYIGTLSLSFAAMIALENADSNLSLMDNARLKDFIRFYKHLMKPIDPRWDIRILLNEGDTRPGSSPFPAIFASMLRKSDPRAAGQLMQLWIEGGRDMTAGLGVPDLLTIDTTIPPEPVEIESEMFPGFGAFVHRRKKSTPEEAYLAFVGGDYTLDHTNLDTFAFAWSDKGVPLTVFNGAMYRPMTYGSLSHNTISWDVRLGGAPDPGKDQPGNWYHDNKQPFVDLGGKTPTLVWEIGHDPATQVITDRRGMVTRMVQSNAATLIEGTVHIKAMSEHPYRADNYAIATALQAWPPSKTLDQPFTWKRRLMYVHDQTAAGMNYVVIRDDFDNWDGKTPSFNYWSLSEDVATEANIARFKGQLSVDTDMVVLQPDEFKWHTDTHTHNQCETIVRNLHSKKFGKPFSETLVLARAEGQKGRGFLVVLFPYKPNEPKPTVQAWADGAGAKIIWKDRTDYVVLDTTLHATRAAGIYASASAAVIQAVNGKRVSVSILDGKAEKMPNGVTAEPVRDLTKSR